MRARRNRRPLGRLNTARAKLTICEMDGDPCKVAAHEAAPTAAGLDRTSTGPRTYILGHITNPEPLLELLADCDTWE